MGVFVVHLRQPRGPWNLRNLRQVASQGTGNSTAAAWRPRMFQVHFGQPTWCRILWSLCLVPWWRTNLHLKSYLCCWNRWQINHSHILLFIDIYEKSVLLALNCGLSSFIDTPDETKQNKLKLLVGWHNDKHGWWKFLQLAGWLLERNAKWPLVHLLA